MPPFESETATTRTPASSRNLAANDPALPNPWTAAVAPLSESDILLAASSMATKHPSAVASLRPAEPPSESGFPVTTPSVE